MDVAISSNWKGYELLSLTPSASSQPLNISRIHSSFEDFRLGPFVCINTALHPQVAHRWANRSMTHAHTCGEKCEFRHKAVEDRHFCVITAFSIARSNCTNTGLVSPSIARFCQQPLPQTKHCILGGKQRYGCYWDPSSHKGKEATLRWPTIMGQEYTSVQFNRGQTHH